MRSYLILVTTLLLACCTSPKKTEKAERSADSLSNTQAAKPTTTQDAIDTMQADQVIPVSSDQYWGLYRSNPAKRPFFKDRTKYQIEVTMTADTTMSVGDFENAERISGTLLWNLDENYKIVTFELSVDETTVESSGEEAYEASNNLIYLIFYYDSTQQIEYVNFNDLLASSNRTTFWGKKDDKTAYPFELDLEVPDLKRVVQSMGKRAMSYNQNKRDAYNDYKIESATLEGVNTEAISYLKGYLELGDSIRNSMNEPSGWFNKRMYYQSGIAAPQLEFEEGRSAIRPTKGDINLLGLLTHLRENHNEISPIQHDTVHNYYWTSANGTNVRAKSVWPVVNIGSQTWLAVNSGYTFPKKILGSSYEFRFIDNICPEGWHVPTKEEWETMIQYLGGATTAAKALISDNPLYWKYAREDYNTTGFNIIQLSQQNTMAKFLTSSEVSEDKMAVVSFSQQEETGPTVEFVEGYKTHAYRCRCVRD